LLKEAAGVLARAAQADRRPRFDATFSGGLSNTYDNPLFHYLPDELFPIFTNLPKPEIPPPTVEPSRFAALRGFGRSLNGRWEPFFKVAVTYELPFGNNRSGGRALQAQASLQSSTVQAADIDRLILDNVTQAAGALRATAETILRRRETIELQRTTLDGALARMRGGELSLIDTLTTEDDLKREQVQLVEDQLQYFSTLARLRFETGQLVTIDGEGAPALGLTFSSREFITP
jgi:outer membrane protein TolC